MPYYRLLCLSPVVLAGKEGPRESISNASSFRVEARRAESPESSNHRRWLLDSGFAATRRPGMTGLMESVPS